MLDTVESGVVRQLDGTTRAPVAWDHFIGGVNVGGGMIAGRAWRGQARRRSW
jgi:hypothetical protein